MTIPSALISIGVFLALQLIAAVWWAATINTKMDFMIVSSKSLTDLEVKFGEASSKYSTKEEVAVALTMANKDIAALWKQIDLIKAVVK